MSHMSKTKSHTSLTHPLLAQVEFYTCKADISREHIRVDKYDLEVFLQNSTT
jgi:hypothetical protein